MMQQPGVGDVYVQGDRYFEVVETDNASNLSPGFHGDKLVGPFVLVHSIHADTAIPAEIVCVKVDPNTME